MAALNSKPTRRTRISSPDSFGIFLPPHQPLVVVLSGPSGAGKDAVMSHMRSLDLPLDFIVTVTTRPRRPLEREGIDYHFVSRERFHEMIERNELLEWANVYGNWYGVPLRPIKEAILAGRDILVKVDVQGADTIRQELPQAVFIFLTPARQEELVARLRNRNTESNFDLDRRLEAVRREMEQIAKFDYVVVNRDNQLDEAVSDIQAILRAEKCRTCVRQYQSILKE